MAPVNAPDRRLLERDIAGATAAHRRLQALLHGLTDDTARRPSVLPGWSVGHVLTHIARNADSHRGMLEAANRGEAAAQYPGGLEQRSGDIEAGAGRTAAALVADVATSAAALEAAWAAMTDDGWRGTGDTVRGPVEVADLPFRRWRETTVHHADLGLDDGWAAWPADYVRLELDRMTMLWNSRRPMGLTGLPPAALAVPPAHRLAWLMGRAAIEGLGDPGLMA